MLFKEGTLATENIFRQLLYCTHNDTVKHDHCKRERENSFCLPYRHFNRMWDDENHYIGYDENH